MFQVPDLTDAMKVALNATEYDDEDDFPAPTLGLVAYCRFCGCLHIGDGAAWVKVCCYPGAGK